MCKHITHSISIILVSIAKKSPCSNAFCVAKESLTFTAVRLVQCQHAERQLEHNMQEGNEGNNLKEAKSLCYESSTPGTCSNWPSNPRLP